MAPTTVSATTEGGPAAAPWARGRKARAVTALETEARHTGAVLGAVPGMRGAARREVTASWCTPPQATHSPAGSAQSAWTRPSVRAGRGASGVQLVPPPATRTRRITPPAPAGMELRRLELSDGAAQRRCSHRTRGGRSVAICAPHLPTPAAAHRPCQRRQWHAGRGFRRPFEPRRPCWALQGRAQPGVRVVVPSGGGSAGGCKRAANCQPAARWRGGPLPPGAGAAARLAHGRSLRQRPKWQQARATPAQRRCPAQGWSGLSAWSPA